MEQPAMRNVTKEDSQSAADRPTADHIGLQGEEKETSEGIYEEIDFTMEYTTCHTLQLHELLCRQFWTVLSDLLKFIGVHLVWSGQTNARAFLFRA